MSFGKYRKEGGARAIQGWGVAGGQLPNPVFGSSVKPIPSRVVDYAPRFLEDAPPLI